MADDVEYTRLHITPFSPVLLNTFLPSSILPNARNISYHNIHTFPEKGYGYVELPTMDAEKIKKKLNGSILKGTKVKLEKARPQKEMAIEPPIPAPPKREKKKRKRDELPGVEIGERQVKRGWTTPAKDITKSKDKKAVNKSKYTTNPECLFKTNLPPNVASNTKVEIKVDKRKKKAGKEVVVHEFAKTTKYATFLRSSGANKTKHSAEYVQGKGWVDEEGNVVEEVITKTKKLKTPTPEPEQESSESSASEDSQDEAMPDSGPAPANVNPIIPDTAYTSSDDSSYDSTSEEKMKDVKVDQPADDSSSLSDSSSSDSDSDTSEDESMAEVDDIKVDEVAEASSDSSDSSDSSSESDTSDEATEVEQPQSAISNRSQSSINRGLSIKIPESNNATPITSSVHPLEALYKRSKTDNTNTSKETAPSFSFFGADDNDEDIEEESHLQIPLTPFTQRDFEYRGLRSAAPTPDTAHPNKRFVWPTEVDEDDEPELSSPIRRSGASTIKEGEASKASEASKAKEGNDGEPESEFQKWFWENRGNVDRSWKARRRTVAKEKRQRENRKRQDRTL